VNYSGGGRGWFSILQRFHELSTDLHSLWQAPRLDSRWSICISAETSVQQEEPEDIQVSLKWLNLYSVTYRDRGTSGDRDKKGPPPAWVSLLKKYFCNQELDVSNPGSSTDKPYSWYQYIELCIKWLLGEFSLTHFSSPHKS